MKQRIIDRVLADGPMRFDEYMDMCLYDPEDGFFSAGAVRPGTGGDFVTSPEVSPWFGRILAKWARTVRSSDDAILVEVGSGSGSLLAPFVDEEPSWSSVWVVELSSEARSTIVDTVPVATAVDSIGDVPPSGEAVIVANEVLDNLPARLVERTEGVWAELRVSVVEGELALVSQPADQDLGHWCDLHLAGAPTGVVLAAQMAMGDWLVETLTRFPSAHLCVIDYAADTRTLAHRRRSDIVRTYHHQRSGEDALERPGETDITVDVNIDVVRSVVEAVGGRLTTLDQRSFLTSHGADEVLTDLTRRSHAAAADGDVMGQLRSRSEAVDLRALLDVTGFGAFTVFLIESSH
jgi:SAM-dependent MidA family methyltransferase